jgi:polyhydroxybutyrate depolymerase
VTPISLTHDGIPRRYLLQVAESPTYPIVMFLHGTGAAADWAANECLLPTFAMSRFHLVVPEAVAPNPNAPSRFFTNPTRWNDGSIAAAPELNTHTNDVGYLDAVLDDAIRQTQTPQQRAFISGFSNGAGMAFRYAAERSPRVAAIAPIAGYWSCDAKPTQPIPTLYLVGDADPLIPLAGGEVRVPWGNRTITRPAVLPLLDRWADAIRPAELLTHVIPGLGHHWPGGRGQLNPRIGGPSNSTVNANETLWQFFTKFRP